MIRKGSVRYRRVVRMGWRPLSNGRWLAPYDIIPRDVSYEQALWYAAIQIAVDRAGQ